jgi:hypothetical protein
VPTFRSSSGSLYAYGGRELLEFRLDTALIEEADMPAFDLYEYVGYIVPGSVLLGFLTLVCPWIREKFLPRASTRRNASAGEGHLRPAAGIGIFLIVTFLLGHFLHVIAHLVEADPWYRLSCVGGVFAEYDIVVPKASDQNILSAQEFEQLNEKVRNQFGFPMKGLDLNAKNDRLQWCDALMRIQDDVDHAKRGTLIGVFIKDYGLYLGLTAAFGLCLVLCFLLILIILSVKLWRRLRAAGKWQREAALAFVGIGPVQLSILFVATAVGLCLSYYRLDYFSRLFAREVFLPFLALPGPSYY